MHDYNSDIKLGILGGGQLGRMLIQSAIDLDINVRVLDPDPGAPCAPLAHSFTKGSLTDLQTVYDFGKSCDIITIEIENVNADALVKLRDEGKIVYPQPEIIKRIQDKRAQKEFYDAHGFPTAPYHLVENASDVAQLKNFLPAVNKIAKSGYDGRGVQVIEKPGQLELAFDAPGILEKRIEIVKELSVIVARNDKGEVKTYEPVEVVYHSKQNLVDYLLSPAKIDNATSEKAKRLGKKIISKLDMIGLLAVEMFLDQEDNILVNEIAPRPHNSGHQTIESNTTSQYQQHLRTLLGMPLGETTPLNSSVMINLVGSKGFEGTPIYRGLNKVMKIPGAYIHLYGKSLTRPFRKMGHVTILGNDHRELIEKANYVRETLKVIA